MDENSFSICSGNKGGLWENIWFTSEKHEEKVSQIRECVSDKYNLKINLPLNDGETYLNTVDKYSLIGVYVQKNLDIHCLGGYIIGALDRLPAEGDYIDLPEVKIVVDEMNKNRIEKVRIFCKDLQTDSKS